MEQPNHDFDQLKANCNKFPNFNSWTEQNVQPSCNKISAMDEPKPVTINRRPNERRNKISTNRLGGHYSTGRPLPMDIREKIVDLSKSGLKPCQISKQLRVSHGCVSKLLAKWRKTGTVKPEKIGGSRPKKVLPSVARAITVYKHYKPRLQSWQIKEYLIKDGVCNDGNVPSISSINKTLRNQKRVKMTSLEPHQQHLPTMVPMIKEATANPSNHFHGSYNQDNDQKIDFQPSTSKWDSNESTEITEYPQKSCYLKIPSENPPTFDYQRSTSTNFQPQTISCGLQAQIHQQQQRQNQQFFDQQQSYSQYSNSNYANLNNRYSVQESVDENPKLIFDFEPTTCHQQFMMPNQQPCNLVVVSQDNVYVNCNVSFNESLPESSHLSTFLDDVFI